MAHANPPEWTDGPCDWVCSAGEEKTHGTLINIYKYFVGWIKEERDKEFSLVEIEKSEGNQHKLKGNKFHSNLWKKNSLSTVMFSKHWNTLTVGLCCLHPQRCTKYSWAQPTATCPCWPYTEQRHYTHSSEITSKLLWFCENLEPMGWRVQRYFSHINSL